MGAVKADLGAKLQSAMSGGTTPKTGVTPVTGVTWRSTYVSKSLRLQQLRRLRLESDKLANNAERGVIAHVICLPNPARAEIEERTGKPADGVLEPYRDAWNRLQCQQPMGVDGADWLQAIDDEQGSAPS